MTAKKKPRQAKKKDLDDAALRRGYLELYAARDASKRLSRLRSKLGVHLQTVERWMADERFAEEVREIDRRRMQAAESIATTILPAILEELGDLATGRMPPPPELPKAPDPILPATSNAWKVWRQQCQVLTAGYQATCSRRQTTAPRAAELMLKYLGLLAREGGAGGFVPDGDKFGGFPKDDPEAAEAEILRRQRILDRAEAREKARAARRTAEAGTNGDRDSSSDT